MRILFIVFLLGGSLALASLPSEKEKVVWQSYSDEKVAAATSQHRPVIVDFYADWCVACHELDRFVFSSPQVVDKLSQWTTLRVDATRFEDPQAQRMIDRYGVVGLPTLIFLDTQGHEIRKSRVEGVPSLKGFLRSLDEKTVN